MITRYAPDGLVAAANHLAASAGVSMLDSGGNAADAAIATAAAMAVTSPHMCGLGGDMFAVVIAPGQAPAALNGSGRAGSGADAAALRAEGHTSVPFQGDARAVTIPGLVDGLVALHARFGTLELSQLLAPAQRLARDGFPASPTLAGASELLSADVRAAAFGDPAPLARGRRVTVPGVARTLAAIASEGRAGFYEGDAGAELRKLGRGLFSEDDLRAPQADWVQALSLAAFGCQLWTVPPSSQGYLALAGAWIADAVGIPDDPDDELWAFLLVEAARQAAHDRRAVLYDGADGRALLDLSRLGPRAAAIRSRASLGLADAYGGGGTTYLCAVDGRRMGVSLIMSNAADFGSHLVVPGPGIFLHNRGIGFSLEEGHPAEYLPGRRPPHTLSPLAVTDPDGGLEAVMGTMGADAQPQILLQLLARKLVSGQRPGAALRAPRWVLSRDEPTGFGLWEQDGPPSVRIEHDAPAAWAAGLAGRGYEVVRAPRGEHAFGHAQMICVAADGMLCGAADPRSGDGACVGR
ncbi:MAG TPA: gamma-glutamyltransferase [Solirubrobacteraceae bacterium]|nr:gamma-glutamyltransferase [Solirubrobacteraceae bacterium]